MPQNGKKRRHLVAFEEVSMSIQDKKYPVGADNKPKAQTEYIQKCFAENERHFLETGERRRAFVLTFGCQQNEADSETLAGMSVQMGYEICKDPADADLILVNTCAIREHAEKKALSIIGQYKHLKAKKSSLYELFDKNFVIPIQNKDTGKSVFCQRKCY